MIINFVSQKNSFDEEFFYPFGFATFPSKGKEVLLIFVLNFMFGKNVNWNVLPSRGEMSAGQRGIINRQL